MQCALMNVIAPRFSTSFIINVDIVIFAALSASLSLTVRLRGATIHARFVM
jgi:hypothetical protein